MVFKCQENSFLRTFTSKVVSCEASTIVLTTGGKNSTLDGYEVVLENTIFFPEGGGQPADTGYINDSRVFHVARRGDVAVHYVDKALAIGEDAEQKIDWVRREDHMQQHSGQHLISAIFEKDYQFVTISWWLGEDVSYIELDVPTVNNQLLNEIEEKANSFVREGRTVTVTVYNENTPAEELNDARSSRGLPADHEGDIRVINIEGVDSNMCCGTHVTNLCQLQAIKLLNSQKSKRKDKTNVYFLCGNRVFRRLNQCLDREQKLMLLLKSNPSQHVELVDKLQKNVRILSKNLQNVLKELAIGEATKLRIMEQAPKYYSLHKKEAEPDFMNIFIQELDRKDILLFLSTGDEKGCGNIVLYGPENDVQELGPRICELMNGKGAGKGYKFQAKVNNLANRSKGEQLIKEHFHI